MNAGFAKACITPPLGTHLYGFGRRDVDRGCDKIHDDLFVRALFAEHAGEPVLLLGYDLLFFERADVDRIKGALGRALDLLPRQILINTSHTHVGPLIGMWGFAGYQCTPDTLYMADLERATVDAATRAKAAAVPVTLHAGTGETDIPVSRRLLNENGKAEWYPNFEAEVCHALPVTVFKNASGRPVCVLYSVSCHPSTLGGYEVSADYPGAAARHLASALGEDVSLFLQGCGGDTKPRNVANGPADTTGRVTWKRGSWEDIDESGREVAQAVLKTIHSGLKHIDAEPRIKSRLVEMRWPMERPPTQLELEQIKADTAPGDLRYLWANRLLLRLSRGEQLLTSAPVQMHSIRLGESVRLLALEGEPVGEMGNMILRAAGPGVTFPLGYSNGTGLYLPTERMLKQGGYEVESSYEYGFPAQLTYGYESLLEKTVKEAVAV